MKHLTNDADVGRWLPLPRTERNSRVPVPCRRIALLFRHRRMTSSPDHLTKSRPASHINSLDSAHSFCILSLLPTTTITLRYSSSCQTKLASPSPIRLLPPSRYLHYQSRKASINALSLFQPDTEKSTPEKIGDKIKGAVDSVASEVQPKVCIL
jgi:hypothetical protein